MKRAVAALIAFAVLLPGAASAADKVVTNQFSKSFPADGIRRLEVNLPVAAVKIRNSARNEISMQGFARREHAGERDRQKAQQIINDSTLDLRIRGHQVSVIRKFGPAAQGRRVQRHVDYDVTITVPPGVEVEVRQDVGELDIEGVFGDLDLEVDVGEVRVKTPKRQIRELNAKSTIGEVTTNLGDRIIEKEGLFAGRTHFLNEGGKTLLLIDVNIGEVTIDLTP